MRESNFEEKCRKLYKKFLREREKNFPHEVRKWLGVKELKLSDERIRRIYKNYYMPSFLKFMSKMRDLILFDVEYFIKRWGVDSWDAFPILNLLTEEGIIEVENRKIKVLERDILNFLTFPLSEEEIRRKLRKIFNSNLKEKIFAELVGIKLSYKYGFDQLPISLDSSIFLCSKILEYLPFHGRVLFVGDDDLTSLLLGLINPKFEIYVVDVDKRILEEIERKSEDYGINVRVKRWDIRKKGLPFKKKFIGICTNPPYTFEGVVKFIQFGSKLLSKDGSYIFLQVGNEAIENRFLFLQNFFSRNNLIIEERIIGRINYPFMEVYPEDREIEEKMLKMGIDIRDKIYLSASLFILSYVPHRVNRLKYRTSIYSYI